MTEVAFLTGATRPELLGGLFRSLASQEVDWEWFVQLDGSAIDGIPEEIDADGWLPDKRVKLERNFKPLGSGATRNQALMRSDAPYVMCVDDDLLYPGLRPGAVVGASGTSRVFRRLGSHGCHQRCERCARPGKC